MAAKKIIPTMEELFATIPEVPEGFRDYCISMARPVPIFYKRKKRMGEILPGFTGDYAVCRCGKCGKESYVQGKPERGEKTSCKVCGKEGLYEWNKCSRKMQEWFTVVLIQCRTDGNLVIRFFHCYNEYWNGYPQRFDMTEEKRVCLNLGDYYTFTFDLYYHAWVKNGCGRQEYRDVLYPGSEEEIAKSNFKYFKQGHYGIIEELKAYSRNPALEMFEKIGLKDLKEALVRNDGVSRLVNRRGKDLKSQLRLKDKQRINFLIRSNGSLTMLQILQIEEKKNTRLTDEQREWLGKLLNRWVEKDLKYLLRYMSFEKMYNRVQRYQEEEERTQPATIVTRYADYLNMRVELGYDLSNEVYLFPKNLREKHDEMVAEKNAKADILYADKKEKEFPAIREKYGKLMKRYGFKQDGLLIRPARSATEIVMEGRTLHHCVGRMGYMDKHNKGQTFILFLRKEEEPDIPYYTIEIKGEEILQWYGAHDKKPDKEVVGPWLNNFIAHIGGSQVVFG